MPFLVILLFSAHGFIRCPAFERIPLDGAKDALAHAVIGLLQGAQQLLDFFALGAAVCRTGIVHDGQLQPLGKRTNIGFRHVEHRTNDGDFRAV